MVIKLHDFEQFYSYFKGLAEKHREIDMCMALEYWQVVIAARSELRKEHILLFLEFPDGDVYNNDSDNPLDRLTCAFVISEPVKINDFDATAAAYGRCKRIGVEVLSHLRKDFRAGDLVDWKPESVRYQMVPMMQEVQNRIGVRFEFAVSDSANLRFDDTKWNP